ncbi:MAG TPA: hypothetical protein PKK00_04650 [Bacteroidales bacterium]|nr:hypothetical protein [Bacteroidales bacterium]HPS16698.1 hypothetical protein [Bacteroidales bacterium]
MYKFFRILILIIIVFPLFGKAQQLSNYRTKKIIPSSDTLLLDTLSVIPGSLEIRDNKGNKIDSTDFKIIFSESKLVIKNEIREKFSELFISYKVFPYNFSKSYQHKDVNMLIPDEKGNYNPFVFTYENQSLNIFTFGGLNKNGSISRGVSFGNSQDVVVNSSFNLQLSGKLSSDIDILAAITDNNIPIQPEGNTQQLQDFDKVYIQLSHKDTKLIAGDFELSKPESYFMNFYKKAQGGIFSSTFDAGNKKKKSDDKISVSVAAAISKGKYAKNTFTGTEGNQGPYKLKGAENETYIIVLSGTEKVYINSELMTRGQENDYTIDYNTAEITFTAKRLITKDSRISVEFEYSDKNYSRSLFYSGNEYSTKKTKVRLNYYSEQDIKNQPLQQELSDEQKLILSQIGDSLDEAFVPYVDSIAYTNDQVLYKKIDSLGYSPVYVYCTNADSAHYRLGFSNVGTNKGNYIQIQSSANGKVFKWVAPVGGILQGNYEPVVLLVTPKQKRMITLAADYVISKNTKATVETAMSKNDLNLFSSADSKDDIGYGIKANIKNIIHLNKKDSAGWKLTSELNHEYIGKTFSPVERYRNIEFERDWNSTGLSLNTDQHVSFVKLGLSDKKDFLIYKFNSFLAGSYYTGLQNTVNASFERKGFVLTFTGSLLSSEDVINSTKFIRHTSGFAKKFKGITIGVKEDAEDNKFYKLQSDTLQKNSFSYNEYEGYITNSDTSKNKYKVFYNVRYDYLPLNNSLSASTTAKSTGVSFDMMKNTNNHLTVYSTYRVLTVNDTNLVSSSNDESLLGRAEYYLKAFKGALISSTYYEVGSGKEVKKEFSYVEVAQGQGVYSWTDYNGNNIKELNEFEVAAFQDQANYIRVYTPTGDYIKTFTNQFSQVLNLNPSYFWTSPKGVKKFISRFSNQSTYSIDHKNTDNNEFRAYNPFAMEINDTALVSENSSFRNVFYFNRSSSKFGFDLNFKQARNKILLVNGFDTRTVLVKGINTKWNISRKYSLTCKYDYGEKTNASEYFSTSNYKINYNETNPAITFQPSVSFRLMLNYTYTEKKNVAGEKAFINKTGIEIKYNVVSKGSLIMKINYIDINYNSSENTSVAYEILEGLKDGKNATWNLSYQRNIASNLQLNLSYDGRKSENTNTVHVGSVQLRAYF